jgi:hypothetical protein
VGRRCRAAAPFISASKKHLTQFMQTQPLTNLPIRPRAASCTAPVLGRFSRWNLRLTVAHFACASPHISAVCFRNFCFSPQYRRLPVRQPAILPLAAQNEPNIAKTH